MRVERAKATESLGATDARDGGSAHAGELGNLSHRAPLAAELEDALARDIADGAA